LAKSSKRNSLEFMKDKFKVLRYIESTKTRFRNEKEMCLKLCRIFKMEYSYVWQIWANIKKQHPELERTKKKGQMVERQERDRFGFRKVSHRDRDVIMFETKARIINVPKFSKPKNLTKKENLNLKDIKPISGFQSKWTKGKLEPTEQKTYRGSFQDKD
jgi:hypothetical protein